MDAVVYLGLWDPESKFRATSLVLLQRPYVLSIAEASLADVPLTNTDKPGFRRFIKRAPLGLVLVIAPWKCVNTTPISSLTDPLIASLI